MPSKNTKRKRADKSSASKPLNSVADEPVPLVTATRITLESAIDAANVVLRDLTKCQPLKDYEKPGSSLTDHERALLDQRKEDTVRKMKTIASLLTKVTGASLEAMQPSLGSKYQENEELPWPSLQVAGNLLSSSDSSQTDAAEPPSLPPMVLIGSRAAILWDRHLPPPENDYWSLTPRDKKDAEFMSPVFRSMMQSTPLRGPSGWATGSEGCGDELGWDLVAEEAVFDAWRSAHVGGTCINRMRVRPDPVFNAQLNLHNGPHTNGWVDSMATNGVSCFEVILEIPLPEPHPPTPWMPRTTHLFQSAFSSKKDFKNRKKWATVQDEMDQIRVVREGQFKNPVVEVKLRVLVVRSFNGALSHSSASSPPPLASFLALCRSSSDTSSLHSRMHPLPCSQQVTRWKEAAANGECHAPPANLTHCLIAPPQMLYALKWLTVAYSSSYMCSPHLDGSGRPARLNSGPWHKHMLDLHWIARRFGVGLGNEKPQESIARRNTESAPEGQKASSADDASGTGTTPCQIPESSSDKSEVSCKGNSAGSAKKSARIQARNKITTATGQSMTLQRPGHITSSPARGRKGKKKIMYLSSLKKSSSKVDEPAEPEEVDAVMQHCCGTVRRMVQAGLASHKAPTFAQSVFQSSQAFRSRHDPMYNVMDDFTPARMEDCMHFGDNDDEEVEEGSRPRLLPRPLEHDDDKDPIQTLPWALLPRKLPRSVIRSLLSSPSLPQSKGISVNTEMHKLRSSPEAFASAPFEQQLKCVREEAMLIAMEHFIIPWKSGSSRLTEKLFPCQSKDCIGQQEYLAALQLLVMSVPPVQVMGTGANMGASYAHLRDFVALNWTKLMSLDQNLVKIYEKRIAVKVGWQRYEGLFSEHLLSQILWRTVVPRLDLSRWTDPRNAVSFASSQFDTSPSAFLESNFPLFELMGSIRFLANCSRVCRQWRDVVRSEYTWSMLLSVSNFFPRVRASYPLNTRELKQALPNRPQDIVAVRALHARAATAAKPPAPATAPPTSSRNSKKVTLKNNEPSANTVFRHSFKLMKSIWHSEEMSMSDEYESSEDEFEDYNMPFHLFPYAW